MWLCVVGSSAIHVFVWWTKRWKNMCCVIMQVGGSKVEELLLSSFCRWLLLPTKDKVFQDLRLVTQFFNFIKPGEIVRHFKDPTFEFDEVFLKICYHMCLGSLVFFFLSYIFDLSFVLSVDFGLIPSPTSVGSLFGKEVWGL